MPAITARPEQTASELRRSLGLRDLSFVVIGAVIGSGIFIVPSTVLQYTGGFYGPMLLVWIVAGVLSLLGALTYGELGAMNPEAGGLYVYVRDAFGPLPAFVLGWAFFFMIAAGSIATLAVAFATYFDRVIPLSPLAKQYLPVVMIAVIAFVNVRGVRNSARVQSISTAIKVGAIILMSMLFLALGDGFAQPVSVWPPAVSGGLLSGIGIAMVSVLWSYEGWQYVTFAAGECKEPERTFPRAIAIGTLAIVILYLLANVGYLAALGPAGVQASSAVAADAVGSVFGPRYAQLIAIVIMISMFSACNSIVLTAPRAYYKMARDGVFFRRLADVHPRFGTPAVAIVTSCVIAMLLAATGTFEVLLTYVIFTGWIFYALAAASVFVLRRKLPDAQRPYRVPGYPYTPLAFVLAAAAIVTNTIVAQPARGAIGVAVVLTGVPAYFIWKRRRGA